MFLLQSGKVLVCGRGRGHALGRGADVSDCATPTELGGPLAAETVVDISAGRTHAAAVTSSGTLFVWGTLAKVQLPLPTRFAPEDGAGTTLSSLACGDGTTVAWLEAGLGMVPGDDHGSLAAPSDPTAACVRLAHSLTVLLDTPVPVAAWTAGVHSLLSMLAEYLPLADCTPPSPTSMSGERPAADADSSAGDLVSTLTALKNRVLLPWATKQPARDPAASGDAADAASLGSAASLHSSPESLAEAAVLSDAARSVLFAGWTVLGIADDERQVLLDTIVSSISSPAAEDDVAAAEASFSANVDKLLPSFTDRLEFTRTLLPKAPALDAISDGQARLLQLALALLTRDPALGEFAASSFRVQTADRTTTLAFLTDVCIFLCWVTSAFESLSYRCTGSSSLPSAHEIDDAVLAL